MNIDEHVRGHVDSFFASIDPLRDAYQSETFAYVALKVDSKWTILQARLTLNVQPQSNAPKPLETSVLKAGQYLLSNLGLTSRELVDQIVAGKLETPDGPLYFSPGNSGRIGAHFQPYHADGLKTQSRLIHLTLQGGRARDFVSQPDLDWELLSHSPPYHGLNDVINEFKPGTTSEICRIEVVAYGAGAVDFGSTVAGDVAKLAIRTALTSDTSRVSVGYRVLERGVVIKRSQLSGDQFKWSQREGFKLGLSEFTVPRAAVVHAILNYNGIAQQHYFFADPTSLQNPRRAAYETFDPGLAKFDEILGKASANKQASREFESIVSWLFWMLGFSANSLGGLPRLSDAPDCLVAAPNGNLALVECTVGLLKEYHKLPQLYERAQLVRRSLESSNLSHTRLLPIIVTAKRVEDVSPDIEQAEKLGIHVLTSEAIERLKTQTLFPANADQIYEQAEQSVSAALARQQASLELSAPIRT